MERDIPITVVKTQYAFGDLSNAPLVNPITYELHDSYVWADGIYIFPSIFKEDVVAFIIEVKDKKVINAYKNC